MALKWRCTVCNAISKSTKEQRVVNDSDPNDKFLETNCWKCEKVTPVAPGWK